MPTLFDAQYHLGATRWWTKDLDGALPALEAAVRLQPGHAEARYYLGLTMKQRGDLAGAIAGLREAVRLAPGLAPAQMQLGIALQEAGDVDQRDRASAHGGDHRSVVGRRAEQSRPGADAAR